MATEASQTYIEKLRELLQDYDAFIAELAPFTYQDGKRMQPLRERKEKLLALQPGEVLQEV